MHRRCYLALIGVNSQLKSSAFKWQVRKPRAVCRTVTENFHLLCWYFDGCSGTGSIRTDWSPYWTRLFRFWSEDTETVGGLASVFLRSSTSRQHGRRWLPCAALCRSCRRYVVHLWGFLVTYSLSVVLLSALTLLVVVVVECVVIPYDSQQQPCVQCLDVVDCHQFGQRAGGLETFNNGRLRLHPAVWLYRSKSVSTGYSLG